MKSTLWLAMTMVLMNWTHAQEAAIPVTLSGGHETDPRDRGRPVVLVAAGLGVPEQTFRDAFSHVHPARTGQGPSEEQARANKQVLMSALGLLGVTNDRLDEVSNYYRYRREDGGLWRNVPASVTAIIENGKVKSFTIVTPGAGYTTPPVVTVPGHPEVKAKVKLWFGTELARNGSIAEVTK